MKKKVLSFLKSETIPLLVIILMVTSVRSSLADHYHVSSGSMEYSLIEGDRLIVDKTAYGFRLPYTKIDMIDRNDPAPGEIVIFDSPLDGELLIKRVVAVEGDRVALNEGRLIVNGETLVQSPRDRVERFDEHNALLNLRDGGGPDIMQVTVPPGKLLVLGDHRGNSIDGRYFGFIDKKELYGKAIGVYYRKGEGLTWKNL